RNAANQCAAHTGSDGLSGRVCVQHTDLRFFFMGKRNAANQCAAPTGSDCLCGRVCATHRLAVFFHGKEECRKSVCCAHWIRRSVWSGVCNTPTCGFFSWERGMPQISVLRTLDQTVCLVGCVQHTDLRFFFMGKRKAANQCAAHTGSDGLSVGCVQHRFAVFFSWERGMPQISVLRTLDQTDCT